MEILWDEPKRRSNLDKHAMDFAELKDEFFETALTGAAKHDRLAAIGPFHGRVITVIFTYLGSEAVSVISMRPASIRERNRYDEEGI